VVWAANEDVDVGITVTVSNTEYCVSDFSALLPEQQVYRGHFARENTNKFLHKFENLRLPCSKISITFFNVRDIHLSTYIVA
jgi:hypothetical protein